MSHTNINTNMSRIQIEIRICLIHPKYEYVPKISLTPAWPRITRTGLYGRRVQIPVGCPPLTRHCHVPGILCILSMVWWRSLVNGTLCRLCGVFRSVIPAEPVRHNLAPVGRNLLFAPPPGSRSGRLVSGRKRAISISSYRRNH